MIIKYRVLRLMAVLALVTSGCSRREAGTATDSAGGAAASSGPVSTNELANAFRSAPTEAQGAMNEAANAMAENDNVKAFSTLYALRGRGDLSDPQRKVIAQAMYDTSVRLQTAAAAGNKEAQKLLDDYRGAR